MNKVALINTYCNSIEKLNALREMINTFKSLNVDIFVYSPIKLPEDIENECKFLFYTKENPILTYPLRGQNFWWEYEIKNMKKVKLERMTADYGWASLYQFKKLINFSLTYNYDIFYLAIYDVKMDEYIKDLIRSNEVNMIHPRQSLTDKNDFFSHSLHFTPFDRDMLKKIETYFDYEDYINTPDKAAEDLAVRWESELGLKLMEKPVYDTIRVSNDLYNISNNKKYKLYANNNNDTFKFIFRRPVGVNKVEVNNMSYENNLEDNFLHVTDFKVSEIGSFKVFLDDSIDDYTDMIKQNDEIFRISYEE